MRREKLTLVVLLGVVVGLQGCSSGDQAVAASTPATESLSAPPDRSQPQLRDLKLSKADNSVVSVSLTSVPENSVFAGMASREKPLSIPLQARRQVLLQIRPGLQFGEIQALLEEHDVEPIKVVPEIGLMVVQLRGAAAAQAAASVENVEGIEDLEVLKAVERFATDPRVDAAAPNSILSSLQLRSAVQGTARAGSPEAASGEQQDWGIDDAHVAEIWPRLPADIRVGVIDVGFADHRDLKLEKGLPAKVQKSNHGNHVAGIICAQHNNIGVRGVLKNCTVKYASTENILRGGRHLEGGDESEWFGFFSDYIASVNDFIHENPGVKVINLSLGYNWLPNFSKDPRLESKIKNFIASQGRIYMSILENAAKADIAIITAAGNDSETLQTPLEAIWASPFNYGSKLMLGTRGWTNGLIVEAHDRQGRRAPFSNVGGDITCPGVDILSTTAKSDLSIDLMSGTSMASPYCAGALAALRAVLPAITLRNAVRCIRRSPRSITGVPALDLKYAIDHCTNDEAATAREERNEAIQRWSNVLGQNGGSAVAPADPCRYGMRREFRVTRVADLGDGQGPVFSDAASLAEIRAYVSQVIASGCRQPALISLRFGFDAAYQQRLNFALAIMGQFFGAQYPGGAMLVEVPQFGDFNDFSSFTDRVVVLVSDPELMPRLTAQR